MRRFVIFIAATAPTAYTVQYGAVHCCKQSNPSHSTSVINLVVLMCFDGLGRKFRGIDRRPFQHRHGGQGVQGESSECERKRQVSHNSRNNECVSKAVIVLILIMYYAINYLGG